MLPTIRAHAPDGHHAITRLDRHLEPHIEVHPVTGNAAATAGNVVGDTVSYLIGRYFLDHVLQAHEGVDFDFLRGKTPVRAEDTAGPSHS